MTVSTINYAREAGLVTDPHDGAFTTRKHYLGQDSETGLEHPTLPGLEHFARLTTVASYAGNMVLRSIPNPDQLALELA